MIAKCRAIAHGGTMLEYAMRESKIGGIVMRNMVSGTTPAEVLAEFELVNGYNTRCRNKYLRFEIGIAPQDRDKLQPDDLGKIVRRFVEKMGLGSHQFIAVTHKDTKNLHIHLIANRIGVDGKVYDTDFVSNRSAKVAEEISREMGLTIAKEVRAQREHVAQGQSRYRLAARAELQRLAYESLRKCKSPNGFFADLERKGVRTEQVKNKQGKTYGLRFEYKCEVFKASEIGREFGLHSLFNHYGMKIEGQKGTPFVPQYHSESLSPGGGIASGLVGGLAAVAGAVGVPSDYDPDAIAAAQIENEARRRRIKKRKRGMRL